jgi:hypothetical protein
MPSLTDEDGARLSADDMPALFSSDCEADGENTGSESSSVASVDTDNEDAPSVVPEHTDGDAMPPLYSDDDDCPAVRGAILDKIQIGCQTLGVCSSSHSSTR